MSIKGFKVNNQTEKYDYEALDNLPDIDGSVMKKALDVSVITSGTNNGVTFTNNGDGTWSLSGTASSSDPARKYFVYSPTSIPSWLDSTKTLFINFRASDNLKVHAIVGFNYNGASTAAESVGIYEPSYIRIPDGITGISILFYVAIGVEVNNVTVNEFDVMYASELDPVAYQLKNSFAASMLPSTFARVVKGTHLNSILDYPANFINAMASTEARTLLSEIGFPENFSFGPSIIDVTIVGFSVSDYSTQYLVMTLNGSYVYLGFYNHVTGLNKWSDIKGSNPYPNNLSVNDEIAVQAYSNFTLSSKRWDVNMTLGDSDALGHTQNFKIIPGSDYYIGNIAYVNNGVMGCFLNANEMPLQPLRSSDCSEVSYPYLTDNPNTDLTQYAKLYKFTAPDNAYYLSLNWTLTTSEHWKFFFSNIPMFREGNSGDLIVYENDPMRHKKNKKLCVVGPSYAMTDRRKQANYGNKYVVGFQEYLYPFYDSVTTFGYSGGTWGQMRDDIYISIYSGIVTGYGASVLPKDFTPYDEVLLIGCNPNGFFSTPRQEEGTAGTFDTNTSAVSTFMGGLRGVVEYILNQKPNMKIYLSNFWHCSGTSAAYREICENLNDEMLKLSNLFGLQYIDMYNGTPFNKWNYTSSNTIYTYDGTHPNNDAMREIADVLVRNMI